MKERLLNVVAKDTPLVQLSGSKTVFKKQLIRFGDWIDPIWPDEVMRIDRIFLENLVKNFKANVPGRIPVPLTHTDDPSANTGELIELTIEGDGTSIEDGLYGLLEIRREETAEDIRNELIFDVSISFTDNYVDTETGGQHGPTLLHVALVNNPYIKKMGGFTALAEDLKKLFGAKVQVRMLSESASNKESTMTKVKNDRDFPVEVAYSLDDKEQKVTLEPGQEVELAEDQVEAVQKQLAEAEAPAAEEEAEEEQEAVEDPDNPELKEGDKDLSESARTKRELAETKAKLRARDIDDAYKAGLEDGKIVPAQEEAFRALADALHGSTVVRKLSDERTLNLSELLAEFVDKAPKRVDLDEESGKNEDGSDKGPLANLSKESKQGLAKMNVSEEDYIRFGSKEKVSINELHAQEK